jgi:hypothetical protein
VGVHTIMNAGAVLGLIAVVLLTSACQGDDSAKKKRDSERLQAEAIERDALVAGGPKVAQHKRDGGTVWVIDIPRQIFSGGFVTWDRCVAFTPSAGRPLALSCEGHSKNLSADELWGDIDSRDPDEPRGRR